ncbi:hypothetical protein C8Q76DRAFT_697741 [Earliella scabrosa]|nr:hypothetical protein C8Q76DRAFT_697741 [Earliella scabrosa]
MHLPVPPYMLLYYTLMNCNAHDMRVGLDGRSSTTSNPTDRHVGFGDPHFQANPVPSPHDIGGFQGALLLSRILTLLDQTNKYQRPLIPQTTSPQWAQVNSLWRQRDEKSCICREVEMQTQRHEIAVAVAMTSNRQLSTCFGEFNKASTTVKASSTLYRYGRVHHDCTPFDNKIGKITDLV